MAREEPSDNRQVASTLAASMGTAVESVVTALFEPLGISTKQVKILNPDIIGCRGGTVDQVWCMDYTSQQYVVEVKRLGVWSYLDLVERGVELSHPSYYAQVQLYMHALDIDKALLVAIAADPTATRWVSERIKKRTAPPPLWVEEIEYDVSETVGLIRRARRQGQLIDDMTLTMADVPRDYNPLSDKFPCDYCQWQTKCITAGERT